MSVILPNQTDLYGITDSNLSLGRSVEEVAGQLLSSGIRILQYREKEKKDGVKLEECRILRRITKEYNACFIVDDYVDIAMICHADGIHIGQEDIPLADVRALVGHTMCIGVSTHKPEQALLAQKGGADYLGVGPIFATRTKKDVTAPVGLEYLDWISKNITIPFVCIGGIKIHNISEVVRHGGHCCAMISEIVSSEDINMIVQQVREVMHA